MYVGVSAGNVYLDFFYSALVEFPAALILIFTIERIGRRYPWAIANFVAGIACLVTAFTPGGKPILIINMYLSNFDSGQNCNTLYLQNGF